MGQIYRLRSLFLLTGKVKLSIQAGSLKSRRCVVNVYASITLFAAGIYCSLVPLKQHYCFIIQIYGRSSGAACVTFGHSHSPQGNSFILFRDVLYSVVIPMRTGTAVRLLLSSGTPGSPARGRDPPRDHRKTLHEFT